MDDFWKSVCRICLRNDIGSMKCLSLFESYEESTVCAHISCLARVQIREGDGLPDRICPECLLQLDAALAFRRKCEASDKLLRGAALSQVPVEFKHEHDADDAPVKEEAEASDECDAEAECAAPSAARPSRSVDLQLVCDDCQGRFKTKCKLRVHWKKAHLADKLTCPDCKRLFKSPKAYNIHLKRRSINCTTATKVHIEGLGKFRTFHCKDCSYQTKRINNMTAHLVTHTGEKPYQCNICFLKFSQISSLSSHKEDKHKDYKVQSTCHVCGENILGRNKMYRHLLTHKNDQIQCKVCHKMLKHRSNLETHMRRHTGMKNCSCEQCPARFYSQSELISHRTKVHLKDTSNYKHRCDMCEYATVRRYALIKHKARHTGTNIPCLVCGVFFEDIEKFTLHQKLHTENKFSCPYCDKKYATSKSRGAHIHSKHKTKMDVDKIVQKKILKTYINSEDIVKHNDEICLGNTSKLSTGE